MHLYEITSEKVSLDDIGKPVYQINPNGKKTELILLSVYRDPSGLMATLLDPRTSSKGHYQLSTVVPKK